MKKLISLMLVIGMFLTFVAGCSSSEEAQPSSNVPIAATGSSTAADQTEPEATSEPEAVTADENLLTVEITLPASMFESEDMSTFDFDAYASEQKLISAELNDDGSVTVKMTKSRHREMLAELSEETETTFAELIEGADTPYVKDITHNDDFSKIIIKVVRSDYENAFDFTPFTVGMSAMVYQMFVDMEYHVEMTVQDADSGDIIDTIVYPDDLG